MPAPSKKRGRPPRGGYAPWHPKVNPKKPKAPTKPKSPKKPKPKPRPKKTKSY